LLEGGDGRNRLSLLMICSRRVGHRWTLRHYSSFFDV
jgi:hypothetical protein